ncbi:hypothetical protein ISF_00388 [Cordyceps fumosorosea ARSEF 2679]|uniref:Uncharacterized protein n=1 Tax=Cordyceps fumosorosea (strain ARSEF 2679) TaxID=1081104 RepID=A0A168E851_CORFA|nr:hypothetical protein ISF_00388 [Cordyceps fumosorosea ARSEF 2679]OAA73487.1 hypothetical protein ISF_00388 [Cordyceps fumosorosea ARSEF 2679]
MFGDDFSVVAQTSDAVAMSPISTKSSASSPSLSFTPDQHTLKRQQDRARRDSRLNARLRRYSNSSFADSTIMSPRDTIGNLGLAVYNPTTHTTVPLMAESPHLMPTSSYLPSYSPTSETSHGYSLSYQQPLPQSYNLPMDYSNGYIGASDFGCQLEVESTNNIFSSSWPRRQHDVPIAKKPLQWPPRSLPLRSRIEPAEASMLGPWVQWTPVLYV